MSLRGSVSDRGNLGDGGCSYLPDASTKSARGQAPGIASSVVQNRAAGHGLLAGRRQFTGEEVLDGAELGRQKTEYQRELVQ